MATLNWGQGEHFDARVNPNLFGGNLLFDRDLPDGTYSTVVDQLALTSIRYPGGSITERFFDLRNPDNDRVWDSWIGAYRDVLPLSDFLTWAGQEDHGVTLVLPTRMLMTGDLGEKRPVGDAYEAAKTFVLDVLSGTYGDARIQAFELGNEYWLEAQLNVEEYAQIADILARATQDAIDTHKRRADLLNGWEEPDIVVQVGQFGKYSQAPGHQQNEDLMAALSDAAAAAIDGVVMHYYARGSFDDLENHSYYFDRLDQWGENPRYVGIDYYMTEWGPDFQLSTERGLRQASTMIWMMSEMVARGVDAADVWPVQQQTLNDLSGNEGQSDLTLGGEGLRLMAESLPNLDLERRLSFDGGVGYLYRGQGETVVFLTSRSGADQRVTLDLRELGVTGKQHWSVALGTSGGTNLPDALPEMEIRAHLGAAGAVQHVDLGPYEIWRVTFTDEISKDLAGSAGADHLFGGPAAERLDGRSGPDHILGRDGADTILGGMGNDTIAAGTGADWIDAGPGHDVVQGGNGADFVDLGTGSDRFEDTEQSGVGGRDKVFGGQGNDIILGRGADDGLSGDDGDDTVEGGDGGDTVLGQGGNDLLRGGLGNDDVEGGSGDDQLFGGPGTDHLKGGTGQDTLIGGLGPDQLYGGAAEDSLLGGNGDDLLVGGTGQDWIDGGAGDDILAGGDGNDTLIGSVGKDVFVFDRDDGLDELLGFEAGDALDLRGQGLSYDEIRLSKQGTDMFVQFAGTSIVLRDLAAPLTEADFVFY